MGRLNFIIFFVVLTISGYVTGDSTASSDRQVCVRQQSCAYREAFRLSKSTRPHAETSKIYYKVRYKGSEIKFEPDIFRFVVHAPAVCITVKNERPFQFLQDDRHTTVSLRGPPSVA